MSINRLPEITFVFIVCLVDFVWKYRFGGERFPTSFQSATQKISFALFFRAWIPCKNSFVFAVFLNFIACDLRE